MLRSAGSGKSPGMAGEPDCRFIGAAVAEDIESANGNNNDIREGIFQVVMEDVQENQYDGNPENEKPGRRVVGWVVGCQEEWLDDRQRFRLPIHMGVADFVTVRSKRSV